MQSSDDFPPKAPTMREALTAVDILDYTLTNHINFEAEIRFAEVGDSVLNLTLNLRRWHLHEHQRVHAS